jgi:hemerythrin-like metal-binding protein
MAVCEARNLGASVGMRWSDSYLTGNPLVDQQHRGLFVLISSVRRAVRERRARPLVLPALQQLRRYVDEHFEAEERLMRASGYPGLAVHRAAHAEMRARTAELSRGFLEGELVLPLTLSQFLGDWIVEHIRKEDLALARWLADQGASATA